MPSLYNTIIKNRNAESSSPISIPVADVTSLMQHEGDITEQMDRMDAENQVSQAEALINTSRVQAKELIEAAQAQADQITREIQEQAQIAVAEELEGLKNQSSEAGHKEGYAKGYEEGYAASFESGKVEIENLLKNAELTKRQAKLVLETARQKAARLIAKNETDIISLAVMIAGKIIGKELDDHDEYIVGMAKNICNEFRNKKQVIISVHPANLELFERNIEEFEAVCKNAAIVLLEDTSLTVHGCIVESDTMAINAEVSVQLEKVMEALKEVEAVNE